MAGYIHQYQEQIMAKYQIMATLEREFGPRPVPMGIVEIKKREDRYLELLRQDEQVRDVVRKRFTYVGRGKKDETEYGNEIDETEYGIDDMCEEIEDEIEEFDQDERRYDAEE
jgi:hypothetical protein